MSQGTLRERVAVRDDLPGLLELYRQLTPDDPPLEPSKARDIWRTIESNDDLRYFVAVDGRDVVSSCNIAIVPNLTRSGASWAIIENVVTHEAWRRRGIARRLMGMAIDFAKARGCYKVCLLSNHTRAEAHAFYESLGFSGTAKVGFHMKLK
ncbi:MAG TPA: GNAT family N-acetyltransferase [Fibrobacteria bacterium]|nr:GNAT family N-acetyltransferase [Fibrobacteria bacterium]